jgi:hypothetical protein
MADFGCRKIDIECDVRGRADAFGGGAILARQSLQRTIEVDVPGMNETK